MTMLTREGEQALIDRVLAGDVSAFEDLVIAYEKKIYNLALRMTRNPSDAEDITQEAFLKAYRSLKSFRKDSGFYVWIYRIASNLCIDFLRKEKQGSTLPLNLPEEDGEWTVELPDFSALPEEELERRELRESIRRGLDALPEKQRQILVMRELSGLSYARIGEILDLEEWTVKSRISRARAALAKLLRQEGNLFDRLPSKETDGR